MESSENNKKDPAENRMIFAAALIAAGAIVTALVFGSSREGSFVRVSVDGEERALLPLSQDTEYEIKGVSGGTNLLVIKDGRAYMKSASCPDGLCVKMGEISRSGQSVICLPNRVVAEVVEEP